MRLNDLKKEFAEAKAEWTEAEEDLKIVSAPIRKKIEEAKERGRDIQLAAIKLTYGIEIGGDVMAETNIAKCERGYKRALVADIEVKTYTKVDAKPWIRVRFYRKDGEPALPVIHAYRSWRAIINE